MERIILFDGECNLCDQSVQFIIKRDPDGVFTFASLQSDIGKMLLNKCNVSSEIDSFVLIEGERYYVKSSAALRVCKNITGAWKLLYALVVIPKPLRDFFYGMIAKNRYKWFGKKDQCLLPSPDVRKRFLS
ncbi:thiol-disulfide oxidoreductase DCC family protein [Robertmurraya massiliosenegalensis]|uniref:thiol-disulfide oxidoreductase DCC family protein n=1 Tax=Robertmurraya massiliosenegalensis TaxID=1287657 RepID=UPI0002E84E81|nr:thiol-disulfide oxidoreductase DCC family protein [Robertmurraya massiliosenegalensis]